MAELDELELERICLLIFPDIFRCCILLGMELSLVETVLNSKDSSFMKCRTLLERWRATIRPDDERMHLIKVLQTLKYNKLASSILPPVKQDSDTTVDVQPSDCEELIKEDLDYVCVECSSDWETLAVHLGLPQTETDDIKQRNGTTLYHKMYLALHRKSLMDRFNRSDLVAVLRRMGKGRIARNISERNY
ncbi:PREDICTED: uncharacterized protein LOC109583776 isoform X1 [Amphimedon queenslandica]|uniref:Death domain-containing protein n=1 Tax=Amphimedon queenslandica TaxID=400682 RepID=A0AAN0JCT4_AMPQE|nr:PREDICTED: uncharacterized protein LOC109583776 isoform X1 [Amphimedon queenslandica]|eukprot:XP_019854794.1 PREDICTED: uncharacterized protein LOC109583776 isoform X1 [Amphimedon queenslandica]